MVAKRILGFMAEALGEENGEKGARSRSLMLISEYFLRVSEKNLINRIFSDNQGRKKLRVLKIICLISIYY